jgi:peptidyl-prolyl cis-trans isomerase SurA
MSFIRLLIPGFVLLLVASQPRTASAAPVVLDRLEASVNSALILLSDVKRFRETLRLRAQLDPLFAGTTIASKGAASADKEIVEFLINEKIISSQFPANDSDVEQEITSIQANNRISRDQLKSALKEQGFSFDDYFELIRASIGKRNLIERDIRTKVTISDDDVKNYFYNHYSQAGGGAAARAFHLKIIAVSGKSYKNMAGAREVADRARKSIEGGEAFEDVAKRVSDDPSAESGGDLGTLTEDQIAPLIKEQLKKLKVGELSAVFGGGKSGAFFLLKLVDVKTSDTDRLEKVKEEIRNQLYAGEYQHQIALWLDRQRQNAFIHRAGEESIQGLPAARP